MSQVPRAAAHVEAAPQCFVVGQDPEGHWLAVDPQNRAGGLFKTKQDALHFVEFETGHRPGAVQFAATPLQLKF